MLKKPAKPTTKGSMARSTEKDATRPATPPKPRRAAGGAKRYCAVLPRPAREFSPDVTPNRARLILESGNKWVNGTVLRYHLLRKPAKWRGTPAHEDLVRRAFQTWKDLGIGLTFDEVATADEAEIRVGFQAGDGHWSWVGREVLEFGPTQRTMNLDRAGGLDLDTALHEIGHSLGFPHEHQNPNAGIVWNEDAVYEALAKPPNRWSRETTFHNIIRKLPPESVRGSNWDPDSIMHYAFEAGLIDQPERYRQGLTPPGALSDGDKQWALHFYPPIEEQTIRKLEPFQSVPLELEPAEQVNLLVRPTATRKYTFSTFGESDSVMVLFEEVDGELRFLKADDDSGTALNARFDVRLFAGRTYLLRIRLYYQFSRGNLAVMHW